MKITSRPNVRAWLAAGSAVVATAVPAATAGAAPSVLSLKLSHPAVTGRPTELRVRAVDDKAPVSGAVASFGRGGTFGTSACYAPDSAGRGPGPPFAPGSAVTLSIPHEFTRPGALTGVLRVDAGGCLAVTDSLLLPFTVFAVRPGQTAPSIALGAPVTVPAPHPGPGGAPTPPSIPGSGALPPLPPVPVLPPLGGGVTPLPAPPPLPAPQLPATAQAARASKPCRDAKRRVRDSRRSRQRARLAMLCLLNRERRKYGLAPLHQQQRLFAASYRHSQAMVDERFFSHVEPGGVGLLTRLFRARYLPAPAWAVGENIAWGTQGWDTPRRIVTAWMHSTGHRANILRPAFRQIGIGVHSGVPGGPRSRGATYTTDFGFKR